MSSVSNISSKLIVINVWHIGSNQVSVKPRTLVSPAEFQWSPPGLAASRRRFLMLTPPWGVESPADAPRLSSAEAGVEERRGLARNGISFPGVGERKVASLSDDLEVEAQKLQHPIVFLVTPES